MALLRVSELVGTSTLQPTDLLLVSKLDPSVTLEGTTFSFVSSDFSINDSANQFVSAGFAAGDQVRITVAGETELETANNRESVNVLSVTPGKMILGGIFLDLSAGALVSVTRWNSRKISGDKFVSLDQDQSINGDTIFKGQTGFQYAGSGFERTTILLGASLPAGMNNAETKYASVDSPHFLNSEEFVGLLSVRNTDTENRIGIGGDDTDPEITKTRNAATSISFYTAPDNATLGGTLSLEITSAAVNVLVPLQVGGNDLYYQTGPDVAVTDGGTGASDAAGARANLGLEYGTTAGTVAQGDDARFTGDREWTAETVSQAEAEAGVATDRRAWTAERVRQAVVAWWAGIGTTVGKALLSLANPSAVRFLRINADNTVTARSDSEMRTDLGVIGNNNYYTDSLAMSLSSPMKLVGDFGAADNSTASYVMLSKLDDQSRIQGVLYAVRGASNFSPSATWLINGSTANASGAALFRRSLSCIALSGGGSSAAGNLVTLTHGGINYIALEFTATGSGSFRAFYFQGLVRNQADLFVDVAANVSNVVAYNGGNTNPVAIMGTTLPHTSVSGLGTAATATVTTTALSTTASHLVKVGDYGIGLGFGASGTALNSRTTPGYYNISASTANAPASDALLLHVYAGSTSGTNDRIVQEATSLNNGIKFRRYYNGTTWSAWLRSYAEGASQSAARLDLGLGTAATADVTTSQLSTTAGQVLKVGDYGLGLMMPLVSTDLNGQTIPGSVFIGGDTAPNYPSGFGSSSAIIEVRAGSTNSSLGPHSTNARLIQRAVKYSSSASPPFTAVRGFDGTSWGAWAYDYAMAPSAASARTQLGFGVTVPSGPTATGVVGQTAYDANFFYQCYATNSWARFAKDATWV